jgi:hypothetical protein
MHLEFVVLGPPISNQSPGPNLDQWRAKVATVSGGVWNRAALTGKLKARIINFHLGDKPSLDLDNMSKPILDAMEGVAYENDRQIRQAEIVHVPIDAPLLSLVPPSSSSQHCRPGSRLSTCVSKTPSTPFRSRSSAMDFEQERNSLADRYAAQGFHVTVRPRADAMPAFARDFRIEIHRYARCRACHRRRQEKSH